MCVCTHTLRIDTLSRFKIYLWTNDDNPLMGSVEGRREGGGARARADGRLKRWLRLRGKGPWLEEEMMMSFFFLAETKNRSRAPYIP